jgi:hypothetical protein
MNTLKISTFLFLLSLFFLLEGHNYAETPFLPLKYGLFAKKEGQEPIRIVTVISEKCSGSHYVEQLMVSNFHLQIEPFIHRHYPPWYSLPAEDYLDDPRHYHFKNTDDHLFIILVRNPYDWIRSLHKKSTLSKKLSGLTFSQFIRTPWELNDSSYMQNLRRIFPKVDLNPLDGSHFKNSLEMRTAKILNMLMIRNRANNVYVLNYEIARDYPHEVLVEIERFFHLVFREEFIPIMRYKGIDEEPIYVPKKYAPINKEDLKFINCQLDEEVERSIGYQLNHSLEEVPLEWCQW